MYRLLSLICVASVLCSPLHAEIYRHTDEQGRTVYSDSPRDGGSPVDLPPANTTPAVSPPPPAKLDRHATPVPASIKVQIIQPRDGQVFPNGRIPTTVNVKLQRPLRGDESLRIAVNGKTLSRGSATSARIERLNRGRHQISAEVLGPNGEKLSRDTVSVVAHWPNN
jgi:hypothetical protein